MSRKGGEGQSINGTQFPQGFLGTQARLRFRLSSMQTVVRDPALLFARAEVRLERRADGSLILNSAQPLGRYPATLSEHLLRWAGETPERDFILERTASGAWSGVTYPDGAGCGGGRA
jgi:hypothetical protein